MEIKNIFATDITFGIKNINGILLNLSSYLKNTKYTIQYIIYSLKPKSYEVTRQNLMILNINEQRVSYEYGRRQMAWIIELISFDGY